MCIRHEMRNPHEKIVCLDLKHMNYLEKVCYYVTVIILHIEGRGRPSDGAG